MSAPAPRAWPALALLVAVTTAAYLPSFLVPFQFDDHARILANAPLHAGELVGALGWLGNSRLLASLTLWVDYRHFGDDPTGYHLLSLALHLVTASGVFALATALCAAPRLRGRWTPEAVRVLALVAALVVALHPVQTEAVTYIVQRATVLAAALYVWAAVGYLRGRLRATAGDRRGARRRYAAAAALGVAALLSKENAATLPFALLAVEWIGFGRPRARVLLAGAALLAAVVLAVAVLKAWFFNPVRPSGAPMYTFWRRMALAMSGYAMGSPLTMTPPWWVYALTQAVAAPRYLLLLALPLGLNVDHDVPWVTAPDARVAAGLLLLAAFVALAVASARRAPLASLGLWWMLLAMAVESSVVPLADPMAERRLYLAMPGVGLLAGSAAAALWRHAPRLIRAAGALALSAAMLLTMARLTVWQSPLALWRDATDKSPGKARPWVNLGVAHQLEGRLERAVEAYCRALALAPNDDLVRDNLELALLDLGRLDPRDGTPVAQRGGVLYEMPDVADYCPPK